MAATVSFVTKIRVVTYNVLSPNLCNPGCFPTCDVDAIDNSKRFDRILKKLALEIECKSIICLQEVSTDWHGKLFQFFNQNEYTFFGCNYGGTKTGHMGVAIAFPTKDYDFSDSEAHVVGKDIKGLNGQPSSLATVAKWYQWGLKLPNTTINVFGWFVDSSLSTYVNVAPSDVDEARSRSNHVIFLRLYNRSTGDEFCVATYHMPCSFKRPIVMYLHLAAATRYVRSRAGKDVPVVFAGDFNIQPDSPSYTLMTTGALPTVTMDEIYNSVPLDGDKLTIPSPMKSAYAKRLGKDPNFTIDTVTSWNGAFTGTLDYIWVSPEFDVEKIIALPKTTNEAFGPFPNSAEPSDHLMVGATLSIKIKK